MIAVFETCRVEDGRIRLRDRHLARLAAAGAPAARIAEAEAAMDDLVARAGQPFTARIDVTDDGVAVATRAAIPADPVDLPVHRSYDPDLAIRGLKIADRAWATAVEDVCGGEALLVSPDGRVGETTRAAVICIRADGRAVAPSLHGILPGVTRSWAVEALGAEEGDLPLDALLSARGAAILSAGRGVVPIASVDGRPIAQDPGVDALREAWRSLP